MDTNPADGMADSQARPKRVIPTGAEHADDDECGCERLDNGECGCISDRIARGEVPG